MIFITIDSMFMGSAMTVRKIDTSLICCKKENHMEVLYSHVAENHRYLQLFNSFLILTVALNLTILISYLILSTILMLRILRLAASLLP